MMESNGKGAGPAGAGAALRSDADSAALVVIDMQERLVPAMREASELVRRTGMLIQGCALLGLPIIFTQQYTKGLGETVAQIREEYISATISADVKLAVDDPIISPRGEAEFSYIEKTSFSVMDEPKFADAFGRTGRSEVIVCGIESHVCVMQSALDFLAHGCRVRVAADATASRHSFDEKLAHSRMAQAGITVTTTEALLFDLMKGASHPSFKQISALVK